MRGRWYPPVPQNRHQLYQDAQPAKIGICSSNSWWPDDDETETNIISGLAEFLSTFSAEHNPKSIFIFFNYSIALDDDFDISDQRPRDVEAHLRTRNWVAFDSTIVKMTSVIKHPLELRITVQYFINWDENMTTTHAVLEKARTKDKVALEDWGAKYLSRASESPNVVMEVSAEYSDNFESKKFTESGVDCKPILEVGKWWKMRIRTAEIV